MRMDDKDAIPQGRLKNLQSIRKAAGMTQAQLAGKLNVSMYTVSVWEREVRNPHWSTLLELTEIFGVTVDQLMGCDEEPLEKKVNDTTMNPADRIYTVSNILREFSSLDKRGKKTVLEALNGLEEGSDEP